MKSGKRQKAQSLKVMKMENDKMYIVNILDFLSLKTNSEGKTERY